MFLISSYGTPLAHRASYLALHSSLLGPVVQLIMIILSVTALTLTCIYLMLLRTVNVFTIEDVFSMAHTLTIFEPIWPKLHSVSEDKIIHTLYTWSSAALTLVLSGQRHYGLLIYMYM